MPLYEFECPHCFSRQDRVFRMDACPIAVRCSQCGKSAKKIISFGHGGIQTDNDVPWLPSAVQVLQSDHERPIQTRGEYNRYLKDKGIQPAG